MAKVNAVEDALNRASPEQQARARQVIEEARRNIKLVSMRNDITPTGAIVQQQKIIEEARRTIPSETMQEVDEISPVTLPLPSPNRRANYTSKFVELHPDTKENIERIEQSRENVYPRENAVDGAMQRHAQETPEQEQQRQQGMER